jgi:hypothetical protein
MNSARPNRHMGMLTPIVTEIRRPLEPVTRDPFIVAKPATAKTAPAK